MATEVTEPQVPNIDPEDYFTNLKSKRQETNDEFLQKLYDNMSTLLKKAFALGQNKVVHRLVFALDILEKERTLQKEGFTTFIYRDDVEYYMDKVTDKAVKIIDLESYPREIPDEVAEKLIRLKELKIFDKYFVVFTDYTGKIEREVQTERRRKDPILFGVFQKRTANDRILHDRFYYIADWEDEYCDLTLDKMVSEMSAKGKDIVRPVCIPDAELQTIRDYLTSLEEQKQTFWQSSVKKKSFFDKIKFWERK